MTDQELIAQLQSEGKSEEEIDIILRSSETVRHQNTSFYIRPDFGYTVPVQGSPDVLRVANDKARNNKGE